MLKEFDHCLQPKERTKEIDQAYKDMQFKVDECQVSLKDFTPHNLKHLGNKDSTLKPYEVL